jgi:hypothetical protein
MFPVQILEKLLTLADEYALGVKLGSLQIQSICGLLKQRNAAKRYIRKKPIQKGLQLVIDVKAFEYDDLSFLDEFPFVIERLMKKQILATEEGYQNLQGTLDLLQNCIYKMQDLERHLDLKLRNDNPRALPEDINLSLASEWLNQQTFGHKIDFAEKKRIFDKVPTCTEVDELFEYSKTWTDCDSIDYRQQAAIKERIRLTRNAAR